VAGLVPATSMLLAPCPNARGRRDKPGDDSGICDSKRSKSAVARRKRAIRAFDAARRKAARRASYLCTDFLTGCPSGLELPIPGTLALCRKRRKRLEGLFTVTTRSLNRVQSLRSRRPGKSPAAMLGEAECASGKPGERRRHLRYPRRSRPLPHFDVFASAAFSAARAPARMLAMA